MSFGRKTKTALAPFCLFFSLLISFQAQSSNQCIDLFKVDLQERYGALIEHYRSKTAGLSKEQVVEQGLNIEMLYLIRLKMAESQTQYIHVVNEKDQLSAVQILPTAEGSSHNKMALELWRSHQAKVFVDLLGRDIEAGVFSGFDLQGFKYDRILILSLGEFIFDGLRSRSEVFRHEMRHLGFLKKIYQGMGGHQKIPITTGMVLAKNQNRGFRKDVRGLTVEGYRDFMSFEELWNYTTDARFDVEQLLRRIQQQKKLDDIYLREAKIESAVRRLIAFFERTAQVGQQFELKNFYAVTTFLDSKTGKPSVSLMTKERNGEAIDFLSEWQSLLYGHNIVHGIYEIKSPRETEGEFWLSLPLLSSANPKAGDYQYVERQMSQRMQTLANISRQSAEDLLIAYNEWRSNSNKFLYSAHDSQSSAELAKNYIKSLEGLYKSLIRARARLN